MINVTLVLLYILLGLILLVIVIVGTSREKGSSSLESLQGPVVEHGGEVGGGGGVGGYGGAVPASAADTIDSEEIGSVPSYTGGTREPIGAVKSKLLLALVRMQSIPFEELQARIQADREVILQAIRDLEARGLVRVEGGMVVLSEHGMKVISALREKYAEKEAWYENI
jgi:hypothetical protein